eukprot:1160563-Pelagomonas_calceolata.AAC.18
MQQLNILGIMHSQRRPTSTDVCAYDAEVAKLRVDLSRALEVMLQKEKDCQTARGSAHSVGGDVAAPHVCAAEVGCDGCSSATGAAGGAPAACCDALMGHGLGA